MKCDNTTAFIAMASSDVDADVFQDSSGAWICKAHRVERCDSCKVDMRGINAALNRTNHVQRKPSAFATHDKSWTRYQEIGGWRSAGMLVNIESFSEWDSSAEKLVLGFNSTFNLEERQYQLNRESQQSKPSVGFMVRETLMSVAQKTATREVSRWFVQDNAKELCVCIDVLASLQLPMALQHPSLRGAKGAAAPLIVVRYAAVMDEDAKTRAEYVHSITATPPPGQDTSNAKEHALVRISTTRQEVQYLRDLLSVNASFLSKDTLAGERWRLPHLFSLSFIEPLYPHAVSAKGHKHPRAGKTKRRHCICGALGTQVCGKCGMDFYCGRQCQRTAWKTGHKAVCFDRKKLANSVIDVSVNEDSIIPTHDRQITVKVQIPLGVNAREAFEHPEGRLPVSTEEKDITADLRKPDVSWDEFACLHALVSRTGTAKGYFRAQWLADIQKIRIHMEDSLPNEIW